MSTEEFPVELARAFHGEFFADDALWDTLTASDRQRYTDAMRKAMSRLDMRVEYRLDIKGRTRSLDAMEVKVPLSERLKSAEAVVERRVVSSWRAFDTPAAPREPAFRCTCSGQGGSVYSADCPIHDSHVDTSDPLWRKRYDSHLEAQRRIKERLGW